MTVLVEIHEHELVLLPQGNLMMRVVAMAFDAYLGEKQKAISRGRCK